MSEPKQIIVMRTDLGMRKGKMIAQGAHASIAFLTNLLREGDSGNDVNGEGWFEAVQVRPAFSEWIRGAFVKICVRVDSEEDLIQVIAAALAADLPTFPIWDAGRTEFNGVKTLTCCAIGPDYPENLDPITSHLALL